MQNCTPGHQAAALHRLARAGQADGYGLIMSDPLDAQEAGWMDVAIKGSDAARDSFRAALSASDLAKFDAMRERMVGGLERVHAYERASCAKRIRYQGNSCFRYVRLGWEAKLLKKLLEKYALN